ncbi:MAG: YciI family protein [Pyrinomonadaceae bacterium]
MNYVKLVAVFAFVVLFSAVGLAQKEAPAAKPAFDAALAAKLGADELGMRSYVLVVLKTGPKRVPDGRERDEMFARHLANIRRLAAEGKMALAGPLDGVDGWRGLFIFAVADIEEAKKLVATDPVIIKGEMIAEYHKYYGSAALMMVNEINGKIAKKSF